MTISRLSFSTFAFALIAACVTSSLVCEHSAGAEEKDKPNILLVMADDQGWGDMAYNGHPTLKTPNFDKLAAEGIRFDRFYAAAPVCSPTRCSVMTGRNPNRSGTFSWGFSMRPQEISIAEVLQPLGYRTGHFGKWHLGSVQKESPVCPGAQGFDTWLSAYNFYDNDPILSREGKAVEMQGESSAIAADAAVEFMTDCVNKKEPFLAVVWFGSPHAPHRAAAEDRQLYADQPAKMQDFLGEITGMDRAVGKLRDALAKLGVRDNTVFWYCSDNGGLPGVGSTGGRGNKGQIYEGGLRVPAVIEWPAKLKQHAVVNVPCVTSDILPTVAAICGAKLDPSRPLDGINLWPIITGEETERPQGIGFWQYPQGGISTPSDAWMKQLLAAQQEGKESSLHLFPDEDFMTKRYAADDRQGHAAWLDWPWKLHRIEGKKKNADVKFELYRLDEDPLEKNDLAASHADELKRLQGKLEAWQASVIRSLNLEDYATRGESK